MEIRALQGNTVANGLSGTSSTSTSKTNNTSNGQSDLMAGVGKSDFLQLLVAQLRNQDPLKPMEDKEFIGQMAQLNTVDQLTSMNKNFTDFLNFDGIARASSLIGKVVEADPTGKAPISGTVQEVRLEQGKPVLMVDGQKVQMSDIRKIASAT